MRQHNRNRGQEYLIPDYQLMDAGFFGFAQKDQDDLHLSGGLRFDAGIMAHAHTTWLSDNVDPAASLALGYGCTLQFAPEVCNHWMVGDTDQGVVDESEQAPTVAVAPCPVVKNTEGQPVEKNGRAVGNVGKDILRVP